MMNKQKIIKSTCLGFIFLLLLVPTIYGEEFHLKDGSIIKGIIIEDEPYSERIIINNEIFGNLEIERRALHYMGKNYNTGLMFSLTQFSAEKGSSFDKGPMFSVSSAGAYDEKISTCFDLGYFFRVFDKNTKKYLHVSKGWMVSAGGIVPSDYEYKAHFIMPSIVMRLNMLPTFIQNILDKVNMFPYVGIGGGYELAIVNYTRIDTNAFTIPNEGDFYNKDIDYKTHFYGGLHYKGLVGLSYKISSKATLVGELIYQSSRFEQFLTDDEKDAGLKREKFSFSGICPSIGIRFGLF